MFFVSQEPPKTTEKVRISIIHLLDSPGDPLTEGWIIHNLSLNYVVDVTGVPQRHNFRE